MLLVKLIKKYCNHFLFSTTFHVALIVFIVYFSVPWQKINFFASKNNVLKAQLVTAQPQPPTVMNLPKQHFRLSTQLPPSIYSNSIDKPTVAQGNLLLQLLRQAIQEKQFYPLDAQLLEKTGRARVAFRLLPDGQIEQVMLLKSTGTASLDKAALMTVRAIAPFLPAQHYLSEPKNFAINLEYQ